MFELYTYNKVAIFLPVLRNSIIGMVKTLVWAYLYLFISLAFCLLQEYMRPSV